MNKKKSILILLPLALFLILFPLFELFLPNKSISVSERRALSAFPEISFSSVRSGNFMKDFEAYTLDHFPLRDSFRFLKSAFVRGAFLQKENNGYFTYGGAILKTEYPMDRDSIEHATDRFSYLYEKHLKGSGSKIYLSIIPDQNAYLPEDSGALRMDYDEFCSSVREKMEYAEYIDLFPLLSFEDYYATDTHLRQERILDATKVLAEKMGTTLSARYETKKAEVPFYGVHHGQSALGFPPDNLYYLTSDFLEQCTAIDLETGKEFPIYDMAKLESDSSKEVPDAYEMFLSGPNRSLVEIRNPNAATDHELILFRDSYANAIAPILAEGYAKITLVDLRRVPARFLGNFLDFHGQDVLFLQSTLVLNDSSEIK